MLQQLSRRSKIETSTEVLKVIGAGASKLNFMMYKANLSWDVLRGYIETLQTQGLVVISEENNEELYHLTQKGFDLLGRLSSIQDELNVSPDGSYD